MNFESALLPSIYIKGVNVVEKIKVDRCVLNRAAGVQNGSNNQAKLSPYLFRLHLDRMDGLKKSHIFKIFL